MNKTTTELVAELNQVKNTLELEHFLKHNDTELKRDSFGDGVLKLCSKYEMTPSVLQTRIAISKSQFYSLLNGTRKPNKESVVKVSFGLGITRDEMNSLLRAAGCHALDPRNKEDAIIIFGIENKREIEKVAELLKEYGSKIRLLDRE